MSTPHQVFTKDEVKGFVAELMKAFGHAHMKGPTRDEADRDRLERREANDKAILRGELAREKRQRVKAVASDPTATNEDLVTALGGDAAVTPLQLARLVKADQITTVEGSDAAPKGDFMRRVLGDRPSTKELSRFAEISTASGGRIRASPTGSMIVDNEPIEGTNLVLILQYLTKGASNRSKPAGVDILGQILQEGGIKSSVFSPTIVPILGGKSSRAGGLRRGRSNSDSSPRMLPAAPPSPRPESDDSDSDESPLTSQSGKGLLQRAMDYAENGEHNAAFDFLTEARTARAPRDLIKQAEAFLADRRDNSN